MPDRRVAWPKPMGRIPSDELSEAHLPPPGADSTLILGFANSFDGYKHIAARPLPPDMDHANLVMRLSSYARYVKARHREGRPFAEGLDDLRACLWWEWRNWRYAGVDPPKGWDAYLHALLEAIRVQMRQSRGESGSAPPA